MSIDVKYQRCTYGNDATLLFFKGVGLGVRSVTWRPLFIDDKYPNWPEARQFATVKQIQVLVRAGLEPPTTGLRVWCSDHSLTLQPRRGTAAFKTLEPTQHTFNHVPSAIPLTVELTYLIACADGLWESSAQRSWKLSRAISTDLKQTSLITSSLLFSLLHKRLQLYCLWPSNTNQDN